MEELFNYTETIHKLLQEDQDQLRSICSEVFLKKNEELQPMGHTCRTIYFVTKGVLRIYYYKDGVDVSESFEFENSIVARVESLFSGKPSRKAIECIEDAELIAINATKLFELYDSHPELERLFRKIYEEAYVKTVNRIESLQFHSAEERYNNLLNQDPNVIQRIPLKHIASFLGITQVSLSRIRAKR